MSTVVDISVLMVKQSLNLSPHRNVFSIKALIWRLVLAVKSYNNYHLTVNINHPIIAIIQYSNIFEEIPNCLMPMSCIIFSEITTGIENLHP